MYILLDEEHNSGYQTIKVEIVSLKKVSEPKNMFLIERGKYHPDGNLKLPLQPYLNISKIQFIAIAKLSISEEMIMMAAFLNPEKSTIDFWLMNVPSGYEQDLQDASIVDYQGHIDICNLLKITPKPFNEFIGDTVSEININ